MPEGRRPTPRPEHVEPRMIRREDALHHVWGDPEAGYVTDRVLSSTRRLHVLEYELPPGGEFRHSDSNRTVFGADVVYMVVAGRMIIADPSIGEVHTLGTGDGVLMRAGTWHNAFNPYQETVRVVEYFCPPPALGAASDFAKRQEPLAETKYRDSRWDGRWPAARAEAHAARRLTTVCFENGLLEFRDDKATHLRSTLASTDFLQLLSGEVHPGHVEEFVPVTHESVVVVTEGELWVDVWSVEAGYSATNVLRPGDAMFLPVGTHERMLVRAAETARYLLGRGTVPDGWTPDDL
jgi:mannose-6-phosphate isomerase-like protein (cupin superfamily)